MYTILVNEDHSLITTKRERIMQRSKNVNSLCFLIKPQLNEINIENSTVLFEYVTPISRKYDSITLSPLSEKQDGYLQFVIPFDTAFTSESGDLQIQLSFLYVDLDENGNSVEQVKKTSTAHINIIPLAAWSDYIPDCNLTAIDQRILKTEAQLRAMLEMGEISIEDKADDIAYDKNESTIQLMSGTKPIGHKIELECSNLGKDGLPVVELDEVNLNPSVPKDENDYIEF